MRMKNRSAIQCKQCSDTIESVNIHDYVICSCDACSIDGKHDYLRRSYVKSPEADYIELSECADIPPCTHGKVLKAECLIPCKESILDLKIQTDMPSYELGALIDGKDRITDDMAGKLAEFSKILQGFGRIRGNNLMKII